MVSLKSVFTVVTAVAGGSYLLAPEESKLPREPYIFSPQTVQANTCGPLGAKRGLFFKPELTKFLSSAAHASVSDTEQVPILPGLDARHFPISTANETASAYFQQGFALLYAFNHWEAIRAFKVAQQADPTCAICYWGEATAHAPNINAGMDAAGAKKAFAAMRKALDLIEYADAREAALIRAAEKRFSDDPNADQHALNQAYADAMAEVVQAFPEDQDIATLYAEALMTVSPWDYWERDFTTPRPHIKVAIDTIESVFAANPEHYGAIHLYIHLYEATSMAKKAAPYADKLAGLAPGSGHLVHMPAHIYFRIGRYLDSLETNVAAAAVDEVYLNAVQGSNLYRYGYYPHNVHFILVSAQMAGDSAVAMEYAAKLDALLPAEALEVAAWIAPIKVAPYFVYAQFGTPETIKDLSDPGDAYPFVKAMWHYARGVVFAENGDPAAEVEYQAIEELRKTGAIQNAGIPADSIVEIAKRTIRAKAAMKRGENEKAIALLKEAVALQSAMPYTEPPFWYYSVEQSLGAALYQAGAMKEAAIAFEASLIRHPNSAWSLYALQETYKALGRSAEAERMGELLNKASRLGSVPDMIKL